MTGAKSTTAQLEAAREFSAIGRSDYAENCKRVAKETAAVAKKDGGK
ncbi:hypothetical protein [Rhizobium sp. 768_B6_N1_8]